MKFFRLSIHLTMILAVLAFIPALALSAIWVKGERVRARARYEHTASDFRQSTRSVQQVEGKLRALTQNVGAVEEEVREQLRMVKPGESLVLIHHEGISNDPVDIVPAYQRHPKITKHH